MTRLSDGLTTPECYRSILAIDGYDERAHEGLIDALNAMGAYGQAMVAREGYGRRMEELNFSVDLLDTRPRRQVSPA